MIYELAFRQPLAERIKIKSDLDEEMVENIGLITYWFYSDACPTLSEEGECRLPYYWQHVLIEYFNATPIKDAAIKSDVTMDFYPLIDCGDVLTQDEINYKLNELTKLYRVTKANFVNTIDKYKSTIEKIKITLIDEDDTDIPF